MIIYFHKPNEKSTLRNEKRERKKKMNEKNNFYTGIEIDWGRKEIQSEKVEEDDFIICRNYRHIWVCYSNGSIQIERQKEKVFETPATALSR